MSDEIVQKMVNGVVGDMPEHAVLVHSNKSPWVEQKPLAVTSLATFPSRVPELVIMGIESNKLWSRKQPDGTC